MYTNDTELSQACRRGDREAFNILVERYQSKVINIAYGMLSNQEDAYDAAQEVFIRIYRSLPTFREHASLSTWIYKITKNVCTDFLRKRMRTAPTQPLSNPYDEDDSALDIPDTAPTPEQHLELNETQRAVREAIGQLNEEYRTVLTLCDLEGLSYEEISEITSCPVGTVKSRLNRARKNLLKILSEKRELFF